MRYLIAYDIADPRRLRRVARLLERRALRCQKSVFLFRGDAVEVERVLDELAPLLDPAQDAARVRAMYTHPAFVRRGIGRLLLSLCEDAARAEGFTRVELGATRAGEPLYRACGYEPVEAILDDRGGVGVPMLRMAKAL